VINGDGECSTFAASLDESLVGLV